MVMYADKIAYLFADLNDLTLRYGFELGAEIEALRKYFGLTQRMSTNACIKSLVQESLAKGCVSFQESETAQNFELMKRLMYKSVYPSQNDWSYACRQLDIIFDFIRHDPHFSGCSPEVVLALLTDNEVMDLSRIIMSPLKPSDDQLRSLGVMEIIPYLRNRDIDITDPGLDW